MKAGEVEVGQQVRVAWKRFRYSRNATVIKIHPPNLVIVRFRDGEEQICHVDQLSLRSAVSR